MVLLCLCSVKAWAQTEPFRTMVYDMNYEGSKYYRIPALATAADGSLVAIADKRGNQLGDLPNDISVVCRRSTDNGETWSNPVVIAQGQGRYKGYGDPCVIYDRKTQKLLCIFAGKQGLWDSTYGNPITINISESSDHGQTWSTPQDITKQIYPREWYGAFAGSGHGLQLKNGRLMFVVAARLTPQSGGTLTNYAVYSDDHGQTWHVSQPVVGAGDEAKVVELANGDVMMSIRNPQKGYHKFALSHDGGQTWDAPLLNVDLKDPACNGDVIRYEANGQDLLLLSLPNSSTTREKVTIYASFDNGQTWKVKKQICDSYSAYSSITVLQDGQIGMLVEEGKWDEKLPGEDGFRLKFVRFGLDWLTGEAGGGDEPVLQGTLNLNGENRYMSIKNSKDFFPEAGGQYTVTCKVKLPHFIGGSNMRFVATRGFAGTDNSKTTGYEMFGGNSSSQAYAVNASLVGKPWGAGHVWSTRSFKEGEWAHLAWTFDGAKQTSTMYINGQEVGTKSIREYRDHAWVNSLDVLVGAGYTNSNGSECQPAYFTTGEIDDVRFFKKTLSAAEVEADRTAKVNNQTEGLVAAYDFENIQGLEVTDISGHGHTGTLVGFPDVAKKYTVNITAPDAKEGQLRVLKGEQEVANGMKIAAGTKLTVEATPTDKYKLIEVLVNGTKLDGKELTLDQDVTIAARFEKKNPDALDYAIPSEADNQRTFNSNPDRLIHRITVKGATLLGHELPFSYELDNANGQKEVFVDATNQTVFVTAGDQLSVEFEHNIIWLHYYVYIDYNHDGVFDPATELVSYSYLNGKNSKGEFVSNGPNSTLPGFQIKPDATPVKTRMRIKTDWDSDSPTGNPTQSIGANGGTIVDFTIEIHAEKKATFPLTIEQPQGGTLEVTDAQGQLVENGAQVEEGTELTVKATPNDGYRLVAIKANDEVVTDGKVVVAGATKISAEFTNGVKITYNKPEGCTVALADANGDLIESGTYVAKNTDIMALFTCQSGYELVSVKVNETEKINDLVLGNRLILNSVQEDQHIVVTTQIITGIDQNETGRLMYDAAAASLTLPEGATAVVYDMAGHQVMKVQEGTVSIADLQTGCYLVRMVQGTEVHVMKLLKK